MKREILPWALKHEYLSIKPSKHHSALGITAVIGSYGITLDILAETVVKRT